MVIPGRRIAANPNLFQFCGIPDQLALRAICPE